MRSGHSHHSRFDVRDVVEADCFADSIAERHKLSRKNRPQSKGEDFLREFPATIDRLEPGPGLRLVMVLLIVWRSVRHGTEGGFDDDILQPCAGRRSQRGEGLILYAKSQRKVALARTCLLMTRIDDESFERFIRHGGNDILFEATGWPTE